MKRIYFYLLIFWCCTSFSQTELLQSGPMVGYCEMKEAMIWLQTSEPATVRIEYFEEVEPNKKMVSSNYQTSKDLGYTCHVLLDELQEGKKYVYQVFINNKKVELPYSTTFSSKKLWNWRMDPPDFSVALGSCTYISDEPLDRPGKPYGSGYEIFNSIADKNPDIMLWGGDNIYLREADWDSQTGINYRYSHSRSIKEMQPLLAKTQNYAIWDDHDYGPNDADRGFYLKNLTQKAFKNYWANKTYGIDAAQDKGTFSTFTWSDAQFFLLDNRWYKTPNDRKTGEKSLLGKEQMEWLIDNLISSKATFKVIVIGGQTLNTAAVFENYSNYQEERAQLLKEIEANMIKGVLFLSGDRHFSELSMQERPGKYPLYDWTVSPLTSGVVSSERIAKEENKNRVEGSVFNEHNFGMIYFSGKGEERQMKLVLHNRQGKVVWSKVILKKELQ